MLRRYSYPGVCSWWDYVRPSDKELNQLSVELKIEVDDIRRLTDRDSRPKTADFDKFSMVVFRTPITEDNRITTAPVAIFFNKNKVITISNKELNGIENILKLRETQRNKILKRGASYLVYRLLDSQLDYFFVELENIEGTIGKAEKKILSKASKSSVELLFTSKKSLIFFHKALIANREVITAIEKEYVHYVEADVQRRCAELYDDCIQLIELEEIYREILVGLLEVYLSIIANNTNKIVKVLTLIASFIWIPTLIAGIYGMNFFASGYPTAMPEISWVYGYPFALSIMVISVVIAAIIFKKKGWF